MWKWLNKRALSDQVSAEITTQVAGQLPQFVHAVLGGVREAAIQRLDDARPLREAIIRLNERLDDMGEYQFLIRRLMALEDEVLVLKTKLSAPGNAHIPDDFDREDYVATGIKQE